MTRLRKLCLLTLPSLLLLLVFAEIVLRFVLPASRIPLVRFVEADQMMTYDPAILQSGLYTIGPLAQQRARWRINAQGWNSPVECPLKCQHCI